MKKTLPFVLVFCVLFAFAVSAHAEGPTVLPNAVSELYSAEGSYTDSIGNIGNYSFHIPQLTADTDAAKEINAEIDARFGEYVAAQLKNMRGGYSLWCNHAEWHSYWNGNLLFLLVSADMEDGSTDYAAYGYDYDKDCRVTNEMILDRLGITEEDYLENLREKVQFMFEDGWRSVSVEDRPLLGYDMAMENTLNWADMDQPMFLNGFGDIVTIVKIASVAGAGWYYYLATPYAYG